MNGSGALQAGQIAFDFEAPMAVAPPDLRELAERELARLLSEFPLKRPVTIEWRALRVTAGLAYYQDYRIALSADLLTSDERLLLTLRHEFAHLLAVDRHGKRGAGHGAAWKQAMRDLGEPPTVRHTYDVRRNAARQVVVYACGRCGARFERKRRLPKRRKYVHASCGGPLRLIEVLAVEVD